MCSSNDKRFTEYKVVRLRKMLRGKEQVKRKIKNWMA